MKRSSVRSEIRQSRPFRSKKQEATIALLRTASVVSRALSRVLEPWSLSLAQYNALRIIRGAGADGIATLAIRERMIEEGTTITRILDRLEESGYIGRERDFPDRRQVKCQVTTDGRRLLDRIDPIVDSADEEAMESLSVRDVEQFVDMLDTIRAANAERGAPRTMVRRGSRGIFGMTRSGVVAALPVRGSSDGGGGRMCRAREATNTCSAAPTNSCIRICQEDILADISIALEFVRKILLRSELGSASSRQPEHAEPG